MNENSAFGEAFPPRSIAIVGVSRYENPLHPGYTGLRLLRALHNAEFKGSLYPVNPNADEIEGYKVYPRVSAIPERVDLATITVPAEAVPQVLEDCAAAKVPNVQICTSGFGETGEARGKELDEKVREIALRGRLRVVGPNCMGFHVPSVRMRMFEDVSIVGGPVAFVSQSGGHARIFLITGPEFGLGFSKVISYGNALLTDAPDFLDYLAGDPETKVIGMYLEGVKNGTSLLRKVREINPKKPVLVWKGGLTSAGARAASSHTGSLAGDKEIWDAFFRQTGAIRVGSVQEMAEVAVPLLKLKPLGRRAAVIVAGGGASVATGDTCAEEGLDLPSLSQQSRRKFLEFVSLVNQGVSNPLDVPAVVMGASYLRRAMEILAADPDIELTIVHVGAEFFAGPVSVEEFKGIVLDANRLPGNKPVVAAISEEGQIRDAEKYAREIRQAGIVAYSSLRSACRALNRAAGYYEHLAQLRC